MNITHRMPTIAPARPQPCVPSVRLIIQSEYPEDLDRIRKGAFAPDDGGNRIRAELPIVNGIAVEVNPRKVNQLMEVFRGCKAVKVLHDAPVFIPQPIEEEPGLQLDMGMPVTRANELHQQGITGRGVNIAVLDTGIAPHPDVADRIVAFQDMVNNRREAYDDNGHGTHVSGIAAGSGAASDGVFKGAAPEAGLVGIKVLDDQGRGSFSDIIRGIQWAVENRDRHNIKVLNLSLGGRATRPYREDPVAQALDAAWQAGLVPVVAAGNEGPFTQTISTPGHALNVITVGADDDKGTLELGDDRVASFSSRGPTRPDSLVKPDIIAPGVRITAPDHATNGYTSKSGTSMATPLIAGIVAQLMQAHPDAAPDQLKTALTNSARPLTDGGDANVQGAGLVDAVAAHQRL